MAEHYRQLDENTRAALKRADQHVLWEKTPSRLRCGDHDIDAYPIEGLGGRVCYTVTSREHGLCIAAGIMPDDTEGL